MITKELNGWHVLRPGHESEDMPQVAGMECLVTIENIYGQILTTLAFTGYGDFTWYTYVTIYQEQYRENERNGDNRLSKAFRVLAWKPKPEPYNPFMQDIRYTVAAVKKRIKTKQSTMEIVKDILPLLTQNFFYSEGEEIEKYDSFARKFWKDDGY